jgi:hypothetical protein
MILDKVSEISRQVNLYGKGIRTKVTLASFPKKVSMLLYCAFLPRASGASNEVDFAEPGDIGLDLTFVFSGGWER